MITKSLLGDQEVVKSSGRHEQMWIVIHMCMETTLGISLYSYLNLKLAKTLWFAYYLLCLLFNKSENKRAVQVMPRRKVGPNNAYTCK
jgi:hypothetical protein